MLRPIKAKIGYQKHTDGSCLFEMGNTRVLCTATIENRIPPFCEEKEIGWVTAEYAMIPTAGKERTPRRKSSSSGRTKEIQRLIGRALRAGVNLKKIGRRTIIIDCDVIQADGGTRTASINGGFIAMCMAIKKLLKKGALTESPLVDYIGAVSVGIVDSRKVLDLEAELDNRAQVDMNVAMTGKGKFIEIQSTAEEGAFTDKDLGEMLKLAKKGIRKIITGHRKRVKI